MVEKASSAVMPRNRSVSLRQFVFRALDSAQTGDRLSRIVDIFLVTMISLSIGAVILESIPNLEQKYQDVFYWFEVVTVGVFTVEYLLRVWSCTEDEKYSPTQSGGLIARLRFMLSAYAIIDLIAILPFYLLLVGTFGNIDMRFLRAVRLLRVLKLTRYSSAFDMLVMCCKENIRSLAASFFVLITVMLLAASGIYFFERDAQPVDFGSIPAAMWWSFATLTTVGYGDVTPVTVGGKVFGALITVVGVGMVALPTGILASGYANQLRLRSNQYQAKADEALDDGVLSDTEISDLDEFRQQLGLGKHTASQIMDTRMVRLALDRESLKNVCPHCGARKAGQ